jgi:peroxiredoxin
MERPEACFAGKMLTVVGPALKPGDKAPDFASSPTTLSTKTMADSPGR